MIKVIQPGIQTTIQDQGRIGYRSYGISVGGAMSTFSSRLANILVGNEMNLPVLEMVQSPHKFLVEEDVLVSFCAGGILPESEGKELPLFEPLILKKGQVIEIKKPAEGFRLYMAIAGGFKAEKFLTSYSTHLLSGCGGYKGRNLKKEDTLELLQEPSQLSENIQQLLQKNFYFNLDKTLSPKIFSKNIRLIKGPEYSLLTNVSQEDLLRQKFKLTNDYNRMGYRLNSDPLQLSEPKEMISSAVTKGTIQLLPDGQLIALMADCQTAGGYPRMAQIIEADHCICAQLKPGDEISFTLISPEQAEQLYLEQEQRLQQIQDKIRQIFS
ncbi:MAG: biotin-dependent carboxyltransferase family protein [Sphingobacteriales bacterium]|nr:biotin-dependent carboxyltransferase family protein [Sphingobacteriales bacterium]